MKVKLERVNKAVHFKLTNETGNEVHTDGTPKIGGEGKGPSPMQLVLMAAASCSSIDVVTILEKMKQPLEHIEVDAEGQRAEGMVPAVFTDIHLTYKLYGGIDHSKGERAVGLSMEKYCSVTKMLKPGVNITSSIEFYPSAKPV